ncbi:MAG: hypothetical protein ACLUIQ_01595 [Dialister invisus]
MVIKVNDFRQQELLGATGKIRSGL